MKVVTFSNLYPNPVMPRHGIFVEQRLRQLQRTGRIEARVVAPVPWFPFAAAASKKYRALAAVPAQAVRHGIEVQYPRYAHVPKIGMAIAPVLMAASLLGTMRRLRESFGDFVIDAHFLYPDGIAACLLGEWLRLPVVLTARGSDVTQFGGYALPRRWIRWAARRATRLITVSEALRQNLIELGIPGQHVVTLRNGVDLDVFQPVERQAALQRVGAAAPLLLSVGNLIDLKGHDLAIRALADLPSVNLMIIGEGPAEQALKKLARETGLENRVRFVGNVSQNELVHYYSAADALVLASEREGMPNVVLESLACGTPVIATKVGGIPEIMTSPVAGQLLDAREPAAIAQAFRALARTNGQRDQIRALAGSFGWDEVVSGMLAVLTTAQAQHVRRSPTL